MKGRWILLGGLVSVLMLALAVGLTQAQGPEPPEGGVQPQDVSIAAVVNSRISYQGVLKEGGQPVNGNRNMVFRFYTTSDCSGSPAQTVAKNDVPVSNGLFKVDLDVNQAIFNGQGLWLAVEVGGTAVGCQEILPVPYALSLRPGAVISSTLIAGSPPLLQARSGATSGALANLRIIAWNPPVLRSVGVEGVGDWGVYGSSDQSNGYGGYFVNDNGPALKAGGTGVIQSTAVSRIFVPGTEAVPHHTSRTALTLNYYGQGLVVISTTVTGSQYVVIPIQVPAVLYGQPVRIRDVRVHYKTSNSASFISETVLRRQTADGDYVSLIEDSTNRTSTTFTYYHLSCTAGDCRLNDDTSFLSARLELYFASTAHAITIGGIRLTLEHE